MVEQQEPRNLVRYAAVGVEFTATFLIPLGLGFWLDSKFGTRPGFTLLGGAIGFAVALKRLIGQGRRIDRDQQHRSDDGSSN
jgi:F0F1-type ATP synthase assembly protein I